MTQLRRSRWLILVVSVPLLATLGCGKPEVHFSFNRLYMERQEQDTGVQYAPAQVLAVTNAVTALFGTPDAPYLETVEGMNEVLNLQNLIVSAGPITSDNYGKGEGLYRQHCVHCHGITGNGRGPTAAFLNPYPRDFTRGIFKFTSTPVGIKPTEQDLHRTLVKGLPGTAMPSFKLLSEGELEALIDYVKYLAIRGEVERKLIEYSPDFYDAEAEDPAENDKLMKEFFGREFLVEEVLNEVVTSWLEAAENVTVIPERPQQFDRSSEEFDPAELKASEDRGRKLYYTSTANCFSCHGPAQLGDGQINDYDQWTKEFFDWTLKNDPNYAEKLDRYVAITGMPPRNIRPRNLREGIYRGGRRPIDIFWRIHNGIDGTPMPAANKSALSDNDIWDLVNYVFSLPYEPVSHPGVEIATNRREVN